MMKRLLVCSYVHSMGSHGRRGRNHHGMFLRFDGILVASAIVAIDLICLAIV